MLSESVLGPVWAFLFAGERASLFTLIGGGIILFAVLIQFSSLLLENKKEKAIRWNLEDNFFLQLIYLLKNLF